MPRALSRGLVYLTALFVVTLLAWATLASVDVVVEADGKLRPRDDVVEVQAPQSGHVETLLVEPGQRVTTGTPLYYLQKLAYKSNVEKLQQEKAQLVRTLALHREGLSYLKESLATGRYPADPGWKRCPQEGLVSMLEELRSARNRLDIARVNQLDVAGISGLPEGVSFRETNEFRLKVEMKRAELIKTRAGLAALESELSTAQHGLSVARDLYSTYERLNKSGVVSRVEYLTQTQQLSAARTQLANVRASTLKSKKEIDQLETDLHMLADQARRSVLDSEKSHAATLASATNRVAKWEAALEESRKRHGIVERDLEMASGELARTVVCSPCTGEINDVRINHPRAMVSSAQTVLTIVPAGTPLEAEVYAANKDVGALRDGQQARVKFRAFPFNEYGLVKGKVRLISADSTKEDQYRMRVELDPGARLVSPEGHRAVFRSGMAVHVEVIKERRRVIDFLLKPFRGLRSRGITIAG
jgi:HlyD family secretion protein